MNRHKLLAIALSSLVLLLTAEAAQAQMGFGRGGRGYGSSFSPGFGSNWSGAGFNNANWYGGGFNNANWGYGRPYSYGYGNSYYNGNWGYNQPFYNGGYNTTYSYPYTSGYTYTQPAYASSGFSSYDGSQPYASSGYQSFYSGSGVSPNQVVIRIWVPTPDARLWIQGQATQQTGLERSFASPPLAAGDYTYTLRCTWMANGREMSREKQVSVRPGQETAVRFTDADPSTGTTGTTTGATTGTTTTTTSSDKDD